MAIDVQAIEDHISGQLNGVSISGERSITEGHLEYAAATPA
jgi:hypothetical protein